MKCQNETELWGPHEGCREFMTEPEVATCDNDAVYRVSWADEYNAEPPHDPIPGDLLVCFEHAGPLLSQLLSSPSVPMFDCYRLDAQAEAEYVRRVAEEAWENRTRRGNE